MVTTVLVHPPPDLASNSLYVARLHEALRERDLQPVAATIGNAVRYPSAPIHIQWPEHLIGHRSPIRKWAKLAVASLLLLDIKTRRRQSIWTAHNLQPHAGWSRTQAAFFRWWRTSLTDVVVLCDGQQSEIISEFPDVAPVRMVHIPSGPLHGQSLRRHDPIPSDSLVKFLQIGVIAPYKQQHEILNSLSPELTAGRASLTIVGTPVDAEYAQAVAALAKNLPNVVLIDHRVPESELISLAADHDVAIGIQSGFNTGVVAAMVPVGLPVVLSPGCQADFYRRELGDGWIIELGPAGWDPVIEWARRGRNDAADLSRFEWSRIAELHEAVYGEFTPG